MKEKISKFKEAYKLSLHECLGGADEIALQHGYELGRQAIRAGVGVMDILSIHREVLLPLLSQAASTDECVRIEKISQDLFAECLAPFELTHTGFIELESLNAKLEAANKELESFSYSVSHDLRAPLRAIDGYVRMILKKQGDKFDEDTLSKFNTVRSEVALMGKLIDELLAFSRLGRKQIVRSELSINNIIEEVWQEILVINPGREIDLMLNSLPAVWGDSTLIRQVCFNLLSNAVKFTKHRPDARIEVGCSMDTDDTGTVFFVKDNGVGFDMAYRDKLFGVFQRLHSSNDFEGTGIGLAIVQRIVHRHGGRVWAEGEVDKGASFYFSLPGNGTD